ncbi:uncharacterized protein KZ484_017027 [Pholidichthys leucotaenia]
MPKNSWEKDLLEILEDMDDNECDRLFAYLGKIPKSERTKNRPKLAEIIIEKYGADPSVLKIRAAIDYIPKNDGHVLKLLQPHVERVESMKKKEEALKRKHEDEKANERKRKKAADDSRNSSHPNEDGNAHGSWKKTIRDVRSSDQILPSDGIEVKVVMMQLPKKASKSAPMILAVADETDCMKVLVFGEKLHSQIKEGKSYRIHHLLKDKDVLKVNIKSQVSEIRAVEVPQEIEESADEVMGRKSEKMSIDKVKNSAEGTEVTVSGRITRIDDVTVVGKDRKKKQDFQLQDDTGVVDVCMWENKTKQCKGLYVGDSVMVTNVKTKTFKGAVSLNSTGFTRVVKVQSEPKKATIKLLKVTKVTMKETVLDAEVNGQVQSAVVGSRLLSKTCGLPLADSKSFKKRLEKYIPVSLEVQIEGTQIKKIEPITDDDTQKKKASQKKTQMKNKLKN